MLHYGGVFYGATGGAYGGLRKTRVVFGGMWFNGAMGAGADWGLGNMEPIEGVENALCRCCVEFGFVWSCWREFKMAVQAASWVITVLKVCILRGEKWRFRWGYI